MTANHSTVLYRNMKAVPPMIVRGEGVYLFDAQGRRYLDGSASASVVGIGHGRSEIWRALVEVGDELYLLLSTRAVPGTNMPSAQLVAMGGC